MTVHGHDSAAALLVLGKLSADERRSVEDHLAACQRCQEESVGLERVRVVLEELPPEIFLDGPPEGGELVLQRALSQVRREAARRDRGRRAAVGAAAAAAVIAAAAMGVWIGRSQSPDVGVVSSPPVASVATSPPAGLRIASVQDASTGVRLTVRVTPAQGWVRVNAAVTGIPAGQRCQLWVVARDGSRVQAGTWLVSEAGQRDGTTLDGAAIVPAQDVAAVEIDNFDGRRFVSVHL
jgi:anti-sigma factor RsiW